MDETFTQIFIIGVSAYILSEYSLSVKACIGVV